MDAAAKQTEGRRAGRRMKWVLRPAALVLVVASPAIAQETLAPGAEAPIERTRFYRVPGVVPESQVRMVEAQVEAPLRVSRGEHHSAPWLADPERLLPVVGRFLHAVDPANETTRMAGTAMQFDDAYVAYTSADRPVTGDRLLIVSVDRKLGESTRVVRPWAIATVVAEHDDVMRVRLTEQFGRGSDGSLALRLVPFEPVRGSPTPVADGAEGQILGFEVEQALYGPASRGFANIGGVAGVSVGDELTVYLPARPSRGSDEIDLAPEPVATLRVLRVAPDHATFRVEQITSPVLEAGLPVVVTRKVPWPIGP